MKKRKQLRLCNTAKTVLIAVLLLSVTAVTALHMQKVSVLDTARSTVDTLKQQCISFQKVVVSDRTKSLFRLIDLTHVLSSSLQENPSYCTDAFMEQFVDQLRLTGVAVLNADLELECSGYTRQFRSAAWSVTTGGQRFADIVKYPQKVFAERIQVSGEYYDLCAVARQDAPGIIVSFYKQPAGVISGTESDLESMLTGLYLEHSGHYAIAESGMVRATSDPAVKNKNVTESTILQRLSQVPKNDGLHIIRADGRLYCGYRSAFEGYILYLYYPFTTLLTIPAAVTAMVLAFYLLGCVTVFAVRNRTLHNDREQLESSNQKLTKTVKMLRALETIYFNLFYVDLETGNYEAIYIAPWLRDLIPANGKYEKFKNMFVEELVLPQYRPAIREVLSNNYIRENLSQRNLTDMRKSFYADYQAVRGGENRWCRLTATVVDHDAEGNPTHVLALIQDVDLEKAKETAYQERILQEAREAKVANEAKTEFLRRISHDIRTPLNGIRGYLNLAADHPDDAEIQQRCRDNANAALMTLMELVNNVLDMSKLEGSRIEREQRPFRLDELMDNVSIILRPQAQERKVSYEAASKADIPIPWLIGSARYVTQILMNLASNAIKYSKPGGFVRLGVRLLSSDDNRASYEFTCEDNGIGMSEEFQTHMFESFTQESGGARTTYEGVGLGLSIVKKLVDVMGGSIRCESQKEVGTTFTVQLSFLRDPDGEREGQIQTQMCLRGRHVLLAEDNPLNMEIAEYLLLDQGAEVTKAWNGKEALDVFSDSPVGYFDLILMDIMMPVMEGLEATRAIRGLPRPDAMTVPISAMSANAFADDVQRSLQ